MSHEHHHTYIFGTYIVTTVANGTLSGNWSWTGSRMSKTGTNVYRADDQPTDFTVSIGVVPPPGGTATITFLPAGVGSSYMAEFQGFPNVLDPSPIPLCMSDFVRVSNQLFTFTDNNPSMTHNNVYYLTLNCTVAATSASGESGTITINGPDPIIINKDPDGTYRVDLPEPQLTAAHS